MAHGPMAVVSGLDVQALSQLTMAELCRLTGQLEKGQTAAEHAMLGAPRGHRDGRWEREEVLGDFMFMVISYLYIYIHVYICIYIYR